MELSVVDQTGKETSKKVDLSEDVFGIKPNEHAIYLDVNQYMANQHRGTHKTKERAEITGSTRKIKRQKGTGTARAGSIKSPIFVGGGRVFGPRPKDHGFKLNKKLKRLARRSALSQKMKDENVAVMEEPEFEAPKTKKFVQILEALEIADKKSVFVLGKPNKNVYLSSRNFKGSEVVSCSQLNTYKLMNADKIVIFEDALDEVESLLNK